MDITGATNERQALCHWRAGHGKGTQGAAGLNGDAIDLVVIDANPAFAFNGKVWGELIADAAVQSTGVRSFCLEVVVAAVDIGLASCILGKARSRSASGNSQNGESENTHDLVPLFVLRPHLESLIGYETIAS